MRKEYSALAHKHLSEAIKRRWQNGENLLKKAHETNALRKLAFSTYIKCEICGTLKRVPHKNRNARFCSMKCYGLSKIGKKWQPNMSIFLPKGNKHWKWNGGITKTRYRTPEEIKWRNEVFARDNFTCQECNKKGVYLEAHHIKRKSDYPELKLIVSNGISLCDRCHKRTYSKEEEYEEKYLEINNKKSLENNKVEQTYAF